jgi:hypothetical protein
MPWAKAASTPSAKETAGKAMLQLAERFLEGDPAGLPVVQSCCG